LKRRTHEISTHDGGLEIKPKAKNRGFWDKERVGCPESRKVNKSKTDSGGIGNGKVKMWTDVIEIKIKDGDNRKQRVWTKEPKREFVTQTALRMIDLCSKRIYNKATITAKTLKIVSIHLIVTMLEPDTGTTDMVDVALAEVAADPLAAGPVDPAVGAEAAELAPELAEGMGPVVPPVTPPVGATLPPGGTAAAPALKASKV